MLVQLAGVDQLVVPPLPFQTLVAAIAFPALNASAAVMINWMIELFFFMFDMEFRNFGHTNNWMIELFFFMVGMEFRNFGHKVMFRMRVSIFVLVFRFRVWDEIIRLAK